MHPIALRIIVLWGWRRLLVAFLAGALSALSQAPFNFFPILLITIPVLIWLVDGIGGQNSRPAHGFFQAVFTGWSFGFGFFLAGLYWVGLAFLVDREQYAWMMPFAVVLLPLGLGLFTGLSTALYYLLWRAHALRILAFATLFVAGEWVRGHIFTGFPWNLIGYSFAFSDTLLQPAALMGAYGLSFLCLLIAGCFALTNQEASSGMKALSGPLMGVGILLALYVFGTLRLGAAQSENIPNISLRIVQPNILQSEKWVPANRTKILAKILRLTNKPTSPQTMGVEHASHIIWPEVALPTLLLEDRLATASIAALLPENKILIAGTIRRHIEAGSSEGKSYNSVVVLDHEAKLMAQYDKSHLVPFGEYLPLAKILEPLGLRKLVAIPTGFLSGPGQQSLSPAGTPAFSPLICYEAIFPGKVVDKKARPDWMLNVTNDAWFGQSPGPYQHFQQSRIRAIEEGLPMVRAANTGISAIIDPYGRIVSSLKLNEEGVIDGRLPAAIAPTPYAKFGDWIIFIAGLTSLIILLWYRFNKNSKQNN